MTAMRPLATALCMRQGKCVLDGVPHAQTQPITDLINSFRLLGTQVACIEETGYPPVTIIDIAVPLSVPGAAAHGPVPEPARAQEPRRQRWWPRQNFVHAIKTKLRGTQLV